jgi:hypothetical protein
MRRKIAGALSLIASAAFALFVACGDSYRAPCSIGDAVVLAEPGGDAETPVFTMSLADDGAEGIVVTIVRTAKPDPDASIQRIPGLPATVTVTALHPDGTIARQEQVDAPVALTSRQGSTGPFGVAATPAGVLFYWVEGVTTESDAGVLSTSAALRVAFVGFDGTQGPVLTADTCTECRMTPAVASAGGITAFLIHVVPDGTSAATEGPPTVLARFDARGALIASEVRAELGAGAGVSAENGLFFFFDAGRLTITDPSLAVQAGPFVLPNGGAGASVDWDPIARELEVGWTSIANDAGDAVGTSSDVLLQRFTADGTPLTRAERVSTGGILEMRRKDGRVGMLVSTIGIESFVLADESGTKIGGDVPVEERAAPHPVGAQDIIGGPAIAHRLFATGGGRYVDWASTTSHATRREIVCDR